MAKPDPTRAHFYPDAMGEILRNLSPELLGQGFMDALPKGVKYHPFFPPTGIAAQYGAPTNYAPTQAPRQSLDDQVRLGPAAMAAQKGHMQPFDPGYTENPVTGFHFVEPVSASPDDRKRLFMARALMGRGNGV